MKPDCGCVNVHLQNFDQVCDRKKIVESVMSGHCKQMREAWVH